MAWLTRACPVDPITHRFASNIIESHIMASIESHNNPQIMDSRYHWPIYKRQILTRLRAEGLIETVGEEPTPLMQDLLKSQVRPFGKTTETEHEVRQRNGRACLIITSQLCYDLLSQYAHIDVASELWRVLWDRFEPKIGDILGITSEGDSSGASIFSANSKE